MLTLNDDQWKALQEAEAYNFVSLVCDYYLSHRAEIVEVQARSMVLTRMRAAYEFAHASGFSSTPHIVRLMYLEADAPGILSDRLVISYLSKPGCSPEQRLDDLDAVMDAKLRGGE